MVDGRLTETCQPKTFDSIHVAENLMNKVEEGAPAKGSSKIKFHYGHSTEESVRIGLPPNPS